MNKAIELGLRTVDEAGEAGYRLAGSQFVKIARDPIVAFLSRELGGDDTTRARLAAFAASELGEALLSAVLSFALSALPAQTGNIPVHLARELRVKAMADAGDVVADLLMGPLRQVISLYIQGQPAAEAPAQLEAQPARPGVPVTTVIAEEQALGAGKVGR